MKKGPKYSALREQLRLEQEAAMSKLTPAARLRHALELSDFCLELRKRGRELRAHRSLAKDSTGA